MEQNAGRNHIDWWRIILEQINIGKPYTYEDIVAAINKLYGDCSKVPQNSMYFLRQAIDSENLKEFYEKTRKDEVENKNILLKYQENYPGALNGDNLSRVLEAAKSKRGKLHESK